MALTFGKTGLWIAATVITAAAAFAGGQGGGQDAKAERMVNAVCTSCHDLRKIQTQALDEDGWKKIVDLMIQEGAKINTEDIPMLVSYLADEYGPLPEGEGKRIVLEKCTVCHDLKRVRQHFATPEDWADLLRAMENEGLMISEDEFVTVLRYLARNFRQ